MEGDGFITFVIWNPDHRSISTIRRVPYDQIQPKSMGYVLMKPFELDTADPILKAIYSRAVTSIFIPITELVLTYA
jgi:hypothetical protein